MDRFFLLNGDCREQLAEIPDDSIDAVVTDPPYEIAFMNRAWDDAGIAFSVDLWRDVLRALKPGGHLVSFGAPRTYHRMACAIEDAGFEIRDSLHWIRPGGFPKSQNIALMLDKAAGLQGHRGKRFSVAGNDLTDGRTLQSAPTVVEAYEPKGDLAKRWKGWGSALGPAHEPIVLARKPLIGTLVENIVEWGVGGLYIDGSKIGTERRVNGRAGNKKGGNSLNMALVGMPVDAPATETTGRWPKNVIFEHDDECVADGCTRECVVWEIVEQGGNPMAFHIFSKASAKDRGEGNNHPTVKNSELMAWLVRLVTPPNGVVLDPFTGSGSTGVAALRAGYRFVGIERESAFFEIASRRITSAAEESGVEHALLAGG
jgi:site-specific DNA-methyltransferase (adenine-specific)